MTSLSLGVGIPLKCVIYGLLWILLLKFALYFQVDKIEESVYQLNKQLPRSDDESEIKSVSSSSLYLSSQSATDDVFTSDSQEALVTPSKKRLRGQSIEEDIPACRSEFSEEEVEMPSVRSLMSKFNSSLGDDESSLKRVCAAEYYWYLTKCSLCTIRDPIFRIIFRNWIQRTNFVNYIWQFFVTILYPSSFSFY